MLHMLRQLILLRLRLDARVVHLDLVLVVESGIVVHPVLEAHR